MWYKLAKITNLLSCLFWLQYKHKRKYVNEWSTFKRKTNYNDIRY